ncbi:MucR family transcriptional regulator [Sulfitobacter sp. R18_1]|uniref:MucR family transcriptional regulator n=1 Tax=Sulfitobacter sp. R18_1 TaxID=2821104 RepID=UPI001AD9DCA9|nr:MucR family transcriptional regulator [Sulfitobacter sp. R18_1]MBO9428399.1 MucR family transcriptional regulator [Sulfitobacter sp. R18_1]
MDTFYSSFAAIGAAYASRKDKTDEEIFDFLANLKSKIPARDGETPVQTEQTSSAPAAAPTNQIPAVDPTESVTKDKIICLECGQGFAMIKRHLNAAHSLAPEEYRAKWGLDPSYPMTSAKFSKKKQFAAKQIGFGTYDRSESKKKSTAKA